MNSNEPQYSKVFPNEVKSDFEKVVILEKYVRDLRYMIGVLTSELDEIKDKYEELKKSKPVTDSKLLEDNNKLKEKVENQRISLHNLTNKLYKLNKCGKED